MLTALYYHPSSLKHETGDFHPENPDRIKAVMSALEGEAFAFIDRRLAPRATREQIARVHDEAYIDRILAMAPTEGLRDLDDDTVMSPGTIEAAFHAAGAVCAAVDAVVSGDLRNAFCAIRPPGHHAEPARAMGFCLFNNVAIGAKHARAVHGLGRVAIVDFDVHHANGTQSCVEGDANLMLVSTHEYPLYPGTGHPDQTGPFNNVVNVALRPESGSPEFRQAITTRLFPALDRFRPDLIMISAGFDAHWRDPLASINLVEDDFAWVTRKLGELAREYCGARIVSTLEGGYDLTALSLSTAAHVRELIVA